MRVCISERHNFDSFVFLVTINHSSKTLLHFMKPFLHDRYFFQLFLINKFRFHNYIHFFFGFLFLKKIKIEIQFHIRISNIHVCPFYSNEKIIDLFTISIMRLEFGEHTMFNDHFSSHF